MSKKILLFTLTTVYLVLAIDMVTIPSGSFIMKSNEDNFEMMFSNDTNKIEYTSDSLEIIVRSFKMGKYEITQSQWKTVMGDYPDVPMYGNNLPCANISWYEAIIFCNKLSKMNGLDTVYIYDHIVVDSSNTIRTVSNLHLNWLANGYRLPTEAEWEYAARGGSSSNYYWGDTAYLDSLNKYTVYKENSNRLKVFCICYEYAPVGSKAANRYGLYDMNGNVSEWCNEWFSWFGEGFSYGAPYKKDIMPLKDVSQSSFENDNDCPECDGFYFQGLIIGGGKKYSGGEKLITCSNSFCKVNRGGNSASSGIKDFKLSSRSWQCPSSRDFTIGFRVVLGNL